MGKLIIHCPEDVESKLRIYKGDNPPQWIKIKNPGTKNHGISKAVVQCLRRYQNIIDAYRSQSIGKLTSQEIEFLVGMFNPMEITDHVANILQQKVIESPDSDIIDKHELLNKIRNLDLIDKLCIVEYIQDYYWQEYSYEIKEE